VRTANLNDAPLASQAQNMAAWARMNEKLQSLNIARENMQDGSDDDSKLEEMHVKPEQSAEEKEEWEKSLLDADDPERLQSSHELAEGGLNCSTCG
jgi:hypothetical protein